MEKKSINDSRSELRITFKELTTQVMEQHYKDISLADWNAALQLHYGLSGTTVRFRTREFQGFLRSTAELRGLVAEIIEQASPSSREAVEYELCMRTNSVLIRGSQAMINEIENTLLRISKADISKSISILTQGCRVGALFSSLPRDLLIQIATLSRCSIVHSPEDAGQFALSALDKCMPK